MFGKKKRTRIFVILAKNKKISEHDTNITTIPNPHLPQTSSVQKRYGSLYVVDLLGTGGGQGYSQITLTRTTYKPAFRRVRRARKSERQGTGTTHVTRSAADQATYDLSQPTPQTSSVQAVGAIALRSNLAGTGGGQGAGMGSSSGRGACIPR
jgi:hypothetical protein